MFFFRSTISGLPAPFLAWLSCVSLIAAQPGGEGGSSPSDAVDGKYRAEQFVYIINSSEIRNDGRIVDITQVGEKASARLNKGGKRWIRLERNGKAGLVESQDVADADSARKILRKRVYGVETEEMQRLNLERNLMDRLSGKQPALVGKQEDRIAFWRLISAISNYRNSDGADFTREINIRPTANLYVERARCDESANRLADFDKALQLQPTNVRALFWRGELFAHQQNWEKAINSFDAVIKIDPQHGNAYHSRSRVRHKRLKKPSYNEVEAAVRDLDMTLTLDPNFDEVFLERARLYKHLGRTDDQINDLNNALARHITFEALFERAEAYETKENYSKAIEDYSQVINMPKDFKLPKTTADAYHFRGWVKLCQRNYVDAKSDLNMSIKLWPENPEAYFYRGMIKLRTKDFIGAIPEFDVAISYSPKWQAAFYERAWCKLKEDDYDGAISDYSELIRLKPDNAKAYAERGLTKTRKRDYAGAMKDYDKALIHDANLTGATTAKAFVLATCPVGSLRDAKQALDLAAGVLTTEPSNGYALSAKACALAACSATVRTQL